MIMVENGRSIIEKVHSLTLYHDPSISRNQRQAIAYSQYSLADRQGFLLFCARFFFQIISYRIRL